MESTRFEREKNECKPIVAICYDFDKTLSPKDMQAQGFIQKVGWDENEFWKESNSLADNNGMDRNLAYMFMMCKESQGKEYLTKDVLRKHGEEIKFFSGVDEWFDRINEYGKSIGVIVEHYVISSGLKEMIEGTSLSTHGVFKSIFASSFFYDENGVAIWPAQVVNDTGKTQFLFRIEKGILNINDPGVNEHFSSENIRIPFRNIIYIGDSDTDIPCMKVVDSHGGYAIGIYDSATNDRSKVHQMFRDGRIKYFTKADYSPNSELDNLIKKILDTTAYYEQVEKIHIECKKDFEDNFETDREKQIKKDLILSLKESDSFKTTHTIISKLEVYKDWTDKEKEELLKISVENSQVRLILADSDVKDFFDSIN